MNQMGGMINKTGKRDEKYLHYRNILYMLWLSNIFIGIEWWNPSKFCSYYAEYSFSSIIDTPYRCYVAVQLLTIMEGNKREMICTVVHL